MNRARRGARLQLLSPRNFAWTCVELPIARLPGALDGLRLIHLSDPHLGRRWYPTYDRLLEQVAGAEADLILITGDLVDRKSDYRIGLPTVQRLFAGLKSRYGSYTVLGNHDGHLIAPCLPPLGTHLIDGAYARPMVRGAPVELIGLPGVDRCELDRAFLASLPTRQPDVPRIVLSHYPDHVRRIGHLRPDLFLAGHTHGGQICLPGGIPLLTHDRLPRRYNSGVHRLDDIWLVVSRGIGFTGFPLRLFCPSQVIEITLRAADFTPGPCYDPR